MEDSIGDCETEITMVCGCVHQWTPRVLSHLTNHLTPLTVSTHSDCSACSPSKVHPDSYQ